MAALVAEVVANSNSPIQVLTANVFSNATAKGTTWRITGSGFTSPAGGVNETLQPSVNVSIYCGATGTNADALIVSTVLPPQTGFNQPGVLDGPAGNFVFDAMVTLRGNSNTQSGNTQVVGAFISPFGLQGQASTNGVQNVANSAANTGNVSVYAVAAGLGQNANLVFETCLITALT